MDRETELELYREVATGRTVVASMRKGGHERLIEWAKREGLFVRIDRKTKWGNPYEMKREADRQLVIEQYRSWLMPQLDQLDLSPLRGRVLGCWCAPKQCHGDVLAHLVNGD